jgi:hypothetical protein
VPLWLTPRASSAVAIAHAIGSALFSFVKAKKEETETKSQQVSLFGAFFLSILASALIGWRIVTGFGVSRLFCYEPGPNPQPSAKSGGQSKGLPIGIKKGR